MPIATCAERTSTAPNAQDAVWVPNGAGNQIYYPYVSSCVTVTLVFQNGLLGGHASQVTPDAQNPQMRPAQNLLDVINRMIAAGPDVNTRGAFQKICFIGTTSDNGWNLNQAANAITAHFGQPNVAAQMNYNLSPVDVVFDTQNTELYIVRREQAAQGAAQTIQDAIASEAFQNY
jgi:hypothetical protein